MNNWLNDRAAIDAHWHILKDVIIVDEKMAKTIAILNEKGYETRACCEGHFKGNYYYEQIDCDNAFLEEVASNPHCTILKRKEHTFDYASEERKTDVYIMFEHEESFSSLPEGFIQDGNSIRHTISFLDDNGNRRKGNDISEEIDTYNKILEKWAEQLSKKG